MFLPKVAALSVLAWTCLLPTAHAALYCWYNNPPDLGCVGDPFCREFVSGRCNRGSNANRTERDSFVIQCPEDGNDSPAMLIFYRDNDQCAASSSRVPQTLEQQKCVFVGNEPDDGQKDTRIPFFVNCTDTLRVCFSSKASTLVRLPGTDEVERRTLDHVRVGDFVESFDALTGEQVFSEVFLVQHSTGAASTQGVPVVKVSYQTHDGEEQGDLHVTSGHYLYGGKPGAVIRAGDLYEGDSVYVASETTGSLKRAIVTEISMVHEPVRNIHTMNDRIVVDGVASTCFAELNIAGVDLGRIPMIIYPMKLLYRMGFYAGVEFIDEFLHSTFA